MHGTWLPMWRKVAPLLGLLVTYLSCTPRRVLADALSLSYLIGHHEAWNCLRKALEDVLAPHAYAQVRVNDYRKLTWSMTCTLQEPSHLTIRA
jgi:hypothetical protein